MRLSVEYLNDYRATLNAIAEDASLHVRGVLGDAGGVGVSTMRMTAIKAIQDTVGIHGDWAQGLAGRLFDDVCAAEGIDTDEFVLYDDIIDFAMLEEKVRYFAKELVESGDGRFLDSCSSLADFYVHRCNWESMVRNCANNKVRYARVPTGAETCDWCVMLASRGFVYWTRADAEHASHEHCDCIAVCGSASTTVEGYDPDALYDRWIDSGFMPPKHGGGRIVPASYQGSGNSTRRYLRKKGMQQNPRGISNQTKESMFERMNAVGNDPKALKSAYMKAMNSVMSNSKATDADYEDIGNHYAYLLTEYHKRKLAA